MIFHEEWWCVIIGFTVGQVIQLVFIVFLTAELFFKSESQLKQAYYYILYITYILDTLDNVAWIYDEILDYQVGDLGVGIAQLYICYYIYSIGTWSFLLSINRFTAVTYPSIHFKFWTGARFYALLLIATLIPSLVEVYSFTDVHCKLYPFTAECKPLFLKKLLMRTIYNITLSIAAIIVVTVAVMKAPKHSSALAKIERKSIIYTLTTSTLVVLYCICFYLSKILTTNSTMWYNISAMFFGSHQYVPMLSLLFLNSIFRREFLNFIKLPCFVNGKKQIPSVAVATKAVIVPSFSVHK